MCLFSFSHGMQGNQLFKYRIIAQQLYHPVSGQCMDCDAERGEIFMNPCDPNKETQKWRWEHLNAKVTEERNKKDGL
jgi:polypeptide N-acetylgalactosaminyltransferase